MLLEHGRYPTRRTWERRLQAIPSTLPAPSGCGGRHLGARLPPWATWGRAAASDRTALRATGGVWHPKDREQGLVPHTAIDTAAHGTTSGWHGWGYGWKWPLVTTVAAGWIPIAAELTAAHEADTAVAPTLLRELPPEVRFVLGETADNDPDRHQRCAAEERPLVTPQRGRYPHTDDGVEVRRRFHQLRSRAIENFNEPCKGIVDAHGPVPTKGLINTRRFALGAIVVDPLAWPHRFEQSQDLRVGLNPFLKAA